MDPFVFDQRFASFARLVDSSAIGEGSVHYEAGRVRLGRMGSERIEGSVRDGRDDVFQVSLSVSPDGGGLSGNCSCDRVFNCAHSYALAREARDRIIGSEISRVPAARRPPAAAASPQQEERERLYKSARDSGWGIYPRQLKTLLANQADLRPMGTAVLRDLKRRLLAEEPDDAESFGSVVRDYLAGKGIALATAWGELLGEAEPVAVAPAKPQWSETIVELRQRIDVVDTEDSRWLMASARWAASLELSDDERNRLLAAKGKLVELPGRGWFRAKDVTSAEVAESLLSLGLSAGRGNQQRVHLAQVDSLVPEAELPVAQRRGYAQRLNALEIPEEEAVPAVLHGVMRPYQIVGYRFLCRLSRMGLGGILADDMGLGKTLQTLAWLKWLQERGEGRLRALVVCPKSVVDNWVSEPDRFGLGLSIAALAGQAVTLPQVNLLVVNYAQLRLQAKRLQEQSWDAVVLDEAQYIKNPSSQVTKAAHRLKSENRMVLTGTPIENRLTDIWSLMRFALPRLLGPLATFKTNYLAVGDDAKALAALNRRLRPFMLRRLKTEVAKDLPERIEEDLYCELEAGQRELYDEELAKARGLLKDADTSKTLNVLQALLRLRQICCHPSLIGRSDAASGKMEALMDIVEPLVAEGHRVLVFSQFVKLLDLVAEELDERKISHLSLTGKTKNRAKLVDRFQSEAGESVFLLSLKAAGSGLTLTAASYVVLLDPWWNPAVEAQAIDRAHRIGQKSTVIAYRLLAKDTLEERIRALQAKKSELAEAVLSSDLAAEGDLKLNLEELSQLLA